MRPPILIVDDNPNNLRSMQALVEGLGAEVVLAASGREALRALLERDFAAVLLDVQMPELDGYQTAELIRSRDRSRQTPILFVTAYSRTEQNILRGYALGAVDYLFKPVVSEVLLSKVSVFLDLQEKTQKTLEQAELLRAAQAREHERALLDQQARFERARLQAEADRERKVARALEDKNLALNQLAEERAQLVDELRQQDRRKNEFLAMLAHELRNPLAPITLSVSLLRRRLGPSAEPSVMRALDAAERQALHMSRLVDDLLDVSRITSGKVDLRRELVTVRQIVEHAVHANEPLITQRRHALEVVLPEEPLHLDVDPARLSQVVGNLLHNAAKYTDPGGHLRVEARADGDGGDELVIEVSDDGIGIEPAQLESIFELFVQVEPTADRAQGGLGLGLTLVKRLVEMHDGRVYARSEGLGRGACFGVRLPRAQQNTLTLPSSSSPAHADAGVRPLRVVLLEDNPDIRATTRDLLELFGHEVHEAEDGPSGVGLVLGQRPDLVLVDIGLPGMDGYTVAQKLQGHAQLADTRLVAVTGYGSAEDRKRALAAGFHAHLVKPLSGADFERLLQDLFPLQVAIGAQ